jgi:CDP-diacylglycerol--glycerol-3-phosphate 3-phosphatidyltransferase
VTSPTNSMRKRFGSDALATPANFITLGRLLLAVPTLLLIARDGATWLTWSLWFVLCISDGIDGWLARRDGATRSGAFLDPIADKVLTLGGFVALVVRGDLWWVPLAIMAAREIGISVYRSIAARRGVSLPAVRLGKWKAFFQINWLCLTVVWIAVILTVVSGIDIVRRGYRVAGLE